jgi:hypothetical protein
MQYQAVTPIRRAEAIQTFTSGDAWNICDALVRVAYFDPDWRWVQSKCIEFSSHPDAAVRIVTATCLSHVARIHRKLDLDKVLPVLRSLLDDPEVNGTAEDALEDVVWYLKEGPHLPIDN